MQIISRSRWGARYSRGFTSAPLPASEAWLHHSVTLAPDLAWLDVDRDGIDDDEEKAMRLLDQIGQDRFGGGISYTWLIPPSGRIYEGHGVDRQGAHTGGRNDRARAICFIGNYDTHKPTAAQVRSAAWLLQESKRRGWLKAARLNGGHRDVKETACPGRHAYERIDDINRLAAGPPITDQQQEDDMALDSVFDEKSITRRGPGRLDHALLNIKQNAAASAVRAARIEAMVAADRGVDVNQLADAVVTRQKDLLVEVIREVVPDEIADDVVARIGEKLTQTEGN